MTYAERIQLIKYVPNSLQTYLCQVFIIPKKVLKAIQAAYRSFLWTDQSDMSIRDLGAWETLCHPKNASGWNITCAINLNRVVICKFLWNVFLNKKKGVDQMYPLLLCERKECIADGNA